MPNLLNDKALAAITARQGLGAGRGVIDSIRDQLKRHPKGLVRLDPAEADAVTQEMETLNEAAGRLGDEVVAFRANVQLQRDAPPARQQTCANCRFFDAVVSTEGHVPVARQAILQGTGVCCWGPPAAGPKPHNVQPPSQSFFTAVHPTRWCGRWEENRTREVSDA